jgi:hypothetical protein
MRILFDQGTRVPLRRSLPSHQVSTAFEMGWSNLSNGELLRKAEAQFDIFITTDQNLRHQQDLTALRLAILVLPTTNWLEIRQHLTEVENAVNNLQLGEYHELRWTA